MTLTETRPWKGKGKAGPNPGVGAHTAMVKTPTVADKIDQLASIRAQMKALKDQDETLSDQLKESLGDGEHPGHKCIAVITTTTPERFDSKSFKSDHPEFAAKYTAPGKPQTAIKFKPLV